MYHMHHNAERRYASSLISMLLLVFQLAILANHKCPGPEEVHCTVTTMYLHTLIVMDFS